MNLCLTVQMEMLSSKCSQWPTVQTYIPCFNVNMIKWCHAVMQGSVSTPRKLKNKKNVLTLYDLPIKGVIHWFPPSPHQHIFAFGWHFPSLCLCGQTLSIKTDRKIHKNINIIYKLLESDLRIHHPCA